MGVNTTRGGLGRQAVDLHAYIDTDTGTGTGTNNHRINTIKDLEEEEVATMKTVGVRFDTHRKPGKFVLYDASVLTLPSTINGLEIMPLREALLKEPDLKKRYYFRAVKMDEDDFTKAVGAKGSNGYFVRVRKQVVVEEPLHAAMFLRTEGGCMCLHNIVVLEEGASLHLLTGCTAASSVEKGLHVAVSEYYVGKGARLVSTMVHHWGPGFVVRPRSGALVDEGGAFVSNYYSVNPPQSIETAPYTELFGKGASAKYMTVMACKPNTYSDIGGTVLMKGEGSSAELVARAVNYGGVVVQTGLLIGAAKDTRGHVDCSGLMLGSEGAIDAVPGLQSVHPDARLSHEAAIGRIDRGEVNYLQSKGLEEMQAIALIIRGFLNIGVEVEGLDEGLEKMIQAIVELSGHGE